MLRRAKRATMEEPGEPGALNECEFFLGVGVEPHVKVQAADALETAEKLAERR
jgi:hypothetical protein